MECWIWRNLDKLDSGRNKISSFWVVNSYASKLLTVVIEAI